MFVLMTGNSVQYTIYYIVGCMYVLANPSLVIIIILTGKKREVIALILPTLQYVRSETTVCRITMHPKLEMNGSRTYVYVYAMSHSAK